MKFVILTGMSGAGKMCIRDRIVSYHEVGHAMVTALQKNTEPVQKLSLIHI